MFGSTSGAGGFGGFGSNNNQQNTSTPGSVFGGGGGFGQPSGTGFGNTGGGAFGSSTPATNAFGSSNSAFGSGGGFGASPNTGGAFGAKPAFGSTTPASGGLFGPNNASATPSTPGFGFGQSSTPSAFGGGNTGATGGGLFGNKTAFGSTPATSAPSGGLFGTSGAAGGAFGSSNNAPGFGGGSQALTAGTSNPPFQAYTEKETAGNVTNHFQTITCMDAYKNYSFEELRLMDYAQGRRYGNASGSGAFGFGTGFGNTGASTSGAGFGTSSAPTSGGLFGTNTNSGFGGTSTATPAFGSTSAGGGGLFGAKPAGGGLFGSSNTTTPAPGGGLFGSNNASSSTGAFGGGTGAFGSTSTGGGLFGGNNQAQNKPAFSFGNASSTPNSGFGANTTSGFGSTTPATGGGLFGGSNQQSTTPGFGTNTGSTFGSGFGANTQQQQQQQQQQPASNAFGSAFGANQQQQKPSGFGGGFGNTATTNTPGGGLFGNNAQAQNTGGGLFGNKPATGFGATTTPSTGGLFGNAQPNNAGGGLFGNNASTPSTGGGLFGNAQNTNTGGGLFGSSNQNKPAGGLFGNSTASPASNTGGGVFGGLNTNTQPQTSSLFGPQQPQQQQGSSFLGGGSSLFGNSQQNTLQQQSQPFSTSINDSPYGNNSFVGSLGNSQQNTSLGPIATPLGSSQTKKAAMIPHHKIAPRQPTLTPRLSQSFTRSASPFAASSNGSSSLGTSGGLGRSFSANSKLNLFDSDESVLSSGAFTPGGNSRVASLKKLVIDKKIRDQDLFNGGSESRPLRDAATDSVRSSGTKGILKKTVSFDVGADRSDQDLFGINGSPSSAKKDTNSATPSAEELGYLRSTPDRRRTRDLDATPDGPSLNSTPIVGNEIMAIQQPQEDKSVGKYWMVPSAQKLRAMGKEGLRKVMNFTVGRRGYGQVRFDNPVDLTGIPCDLDDIPGTVVTFDKRVCTVYPEGLDKPVPGKGMNVPATITLEDCFPVTKNERGKIRDPEHPRFLSHIRRLKSIKDTEFVDYIADDGIWIFKVKHFTTYGLEDSDEEEEDVTYTYDDSSLSSLPTGTPTPTRSSQNATSSSILDDDIDSSEADISGIDNSDSNFDDTFDFKRLNSSVGGVREIPGSFLGPDEVDEVPYSDEGSYEQSEEDDVPMDEQSFLGEGSVGSEDEPAEPISDSEMVEDSKIIVEDSEGNISHQLISATDEHVVDDDPTPRKESSEQLSEPTPKALPMGRDWTEQLNNTISPVKRRMAGEHFFNIPTKAQDSPLKRSTIEPLSYGLLDLNRDLYGSPSRGSAKKLSFSPAKTRKREFESTPSSRTRSEGVVPSTRKPTASKFRIHEKFDYNNLDHAEKAWRKSVRPCWGRDGTLIYRGELEGIGRRRLSRDDDTMYFAKLKSGIENYAVPKSLELHLQVADLALDEYGVPIAKLDHGMLFKKFASIPWGQDAKEQHEKSVWSLASVLWDPIRDVPQFEKETERLRNYVNEKCRKDALSQFLQELVEKDADRQVATATSLEEAAFAHLSAHRVESACAALLESGDFRLATLIPMIGGDETIRANIAKQLESWRTKGVLSEISLPIRALYELLSGETCLAGGAKGPKEDVAPDFFIADQFKLDWKRAFALKLWYGCFEQDGISAAVTGYEQDMVDFGRKIPSPVPWYHQEAADPKNGSFDVLWGLLKVYAHKDLGLEEILAPENVDLSSIDYRLPWQLRTILALRGIRYLRGDTVRIDPSGHKEFAAGPGANQLTFDFAGVLEMSGLWEWAVFVVMHLQDADSRETAIRNILGRYVDDIEIGEAPGGKLDFLLNTLKVPEHWIYEAKALQARAEGEFYKEAEYLIAANAMNEAHKTVIQQVAPEAIISGELDNLSAILAKFGDDARNIDKWALGGQVYLDYIHLLDVMRRGQTKDSMAVAKRLLGSLKGMEMREFLQRVAIREMAGVVAAWVLKAEQMENEKPWVLDLPLSEDQYLKKTKNLSLLYYRARLQEVGGR